MKLLSHPREVGKNPPRHHEVHPRDGFRHRTGKILAAALKWNRTSGAEGLGGAPVILGGERGSQPYVSPQIARMCGIGKDVIHKWGEAKAAFLVRIQ
jgi:hypothetical protein